MMPLAQPRPRRTPRALLAGLIGLAVTACAPLPDIAARTNTQTTAPPPVLVPLGGILAQADAVGSGAGAIDPVNARAARLRARAAALRSQ
ncbi:MAG: hypothetical protein Q7J44_03350 [Pseudotabrizicola sp.]|uniref:hypothetical protein n=1 Tax=Pseudotabrizicola sp. TaxID=2939647 RepID=UPI002717EED3|nr:hypothetical protein [Pseudotabrizicola sp.]MDO9637558.1 hypothetical protein [Pseudotabrizicola sp.]